MDHFAWIAPLYDRIFEFLDPTRLIALLEPGPSHRLLDVGGGTGRVTTALVPHVRQACIVDVSLGMLAQAQDKGLCAYQAVAEGLPFADESFDRILIVDAFHHFHDWPRAAVELVRVLRPGGRLVIEELNIRHWSTKLIALGERLLLMRSRFYAPADLARLFQVAGGRVTLHQDRGSIYWAVIERD
jgi:demethylmenaquinone methyltransferase/2-methoxy-6-polyprenyl-1,4-benzoquinol methylase